MRVLRDGFEGGRSERTTLPCPGFAIDDSKGDLTGMVLDRQRGFYEMKSGIEGAKRIMLNSASEAGGMTVYMMIERGATKTIV